MNAKKLLSLLLVFVMMLSVFTVSASAATTKLPAPTSPMTVDDNIITVAAHSQAWITPEVLGINNTTGRNEEINETFYDGSTPAMKNGVVTSANNDYTTSGAIAALSVFGSDVNDAPNPYMYNYFYNCYAQKNGLTLTGIKDKKYMLCYSITCSPMGAATAESDRLASIDPSSKTKVASLYYRPDILLGVGNGAGVGSTGYDAAIQSLNEATGENYNPYKVMYTADRVYDFLNSMYVLSNVCKEITSDTGKTTRYGDPYIITSDMEKYVKGLQCYVIEQIKKDNAKMPVVAVINYSASSKVKSDGAATATLAESLVGEGKFLVDTIDYSLEPTTNYSRIAEFVSDTSISIIDAVEADGGTVGTITTANVPGRGSGTKAVNNARVVTADQLAKYADVIVFGEVMSSIPENNGENGTPSKVKDVLAAKATDANKARAESIEYMGSAFDCVGSIGANSVENLFGMAYYTAYLYPQYVNQFDVAAYWYRNFYHITDTAKLKSIISTNFAGTSVQSEYASKYTTDIKGYNESALVAKIVEGMKYYEANKASLTDTLLYKNSYDASATADSNGSVAVTTGWNIDWTKGIGSGNQSNVVVNNSTSAVKAPITASVSDETKDAITQTIINNFTSEEREQYNFGAKLDVDITITPVEEKDIAADTLKAIQDVAGTDGKTIGGYINIDINYVLGNNDVVKVTDLGNDEIEITVNLPADLQGKANYVVYREHEGKVDAIIPTVSADGKTLTFKSSKFSTYAIAYGEEVAEEVAEEVTEEVANTADITVLAPTMALISSSAFALYAINKKKKEME